MRGAHAIASRLLLALLAGSAWLLLWRWNLDPGARFADHAGWLAPPVFDTICSLPGASVWLPALAHAAGWFVMICAMMLPTIFPLLALFGRLTLARHDAVQLHVLLALGYVIAWLGFGLLAHGADAGLHRIVEREPWLSTHAWSIGALLLAVAGAFQFSKLKYRCLDRCRNPLSFIAARWHNLRPKQESLKIGLEHGLFCVGCCWALMLLMFVVGTGSLVWMFMLALVMAAEKNLRHGRRLAAPFGFALLAAAVFIAGMHLRGVA